VFVVVVVVMKVPVSGPLAEWAQGFVGYLAAVGYAPTSVGLRLRLFAHLSRWCDVEGLLPAQLDVAAIGRFLRARAVSHVDLSSAATLAPVISFLRSVGAVLPASEAEGGAVGAVDALLDRWGAFLLSERALAPSTVEYYRRLAEPFVASRLRGSVLEWGTVDATVVAGFVAATIPQLPIGAGKLTITALRSLLRYLFSIGVVADRLGAVVPGRSGYRDAGLPRVVTAEQVAMMVAATGGDSVVRRRDRAVLAVMSRLALRAGDVARLELEDLDWRAGTIRVRGKGGQIDLMPLPADVGQALAEHLSDDRPAAAAGRTVFLRCRAPFTALSVSGIQGIVQHAGRRAGLGAVGAHRLRHTVATATINAGASLEEVGQLLRHRGLASTTIYAKVDLVRLGSIARPWPGSDPALTVVVSS
jgi:site-specific recombinase XerD